jgi:hypothetical protein
MSCIAIAVAGTYLNLVWQHDPATVSMLVPIFLAVHFVLRPIRRLRWHPTAEQVFRAVLLGTIAFTAMAYAQYEGRGSATILDRIRQAPDKLGLVVIVTAGVVVVGLLLAAVIGRFLFRKYTARGPLTGVPAVLYSAVAIIGYATAVLWPGFFVVKKLTEANPSF